MDKLYKVLIQISGKYASVKHSRKLKNYLNDNLNDTNNILLSYGVSNEKHNYYIGVNKFVTNGISAMNNDTDGLADDDEYDNDAVVVNYGYEVNDNLKFDT